jgi:hypothetical protein
MRNERKKENESEREVNEREMGEKNAMREGKTK